MRRLWPLLGLFGCVSDFSPDPYNQSALEFTRDAGSADASKPRARADASSGAKDAGSESPPEDDDPGEASEQEKPPRQTGCDLSGRWLMTERNVSSAIGAKQLTLSWFYVELAQEGDEVTMKTAFGCGGSTNGLPPFSVQMDDKKSWPAYMANLRYDGRKGRSSESGSGCTVSFEKMAVVRGATVETYRDLSVPLPTLAEEAAGDQPGWEDWDEDGHPGVTMTVSGTLSGFLYTATRTWSQSSGSIDADAASFTLPQQWGQERVTLGYDGSPLLNSPAERDPDASQQLVEFARLSEDQATGDDAEKCAAIRELAPTLTPNATNR